MTRNTQLCVSGPQSVKNVLRVFSDESQYIDPEQPHVYFYALVLTGQFEAAIAYLARTENLLVHAVHIAIAPNEHHLLDVTSDVLDHLCEYMQILWIEVLLPPI
jgi:nuclear pore complex protein Nup93